MTVLGAPRRWAQSSVPEALQSENDIFPSKLRGGDPSVNHQKVKHNARDQGGCQSCTSFALATMYEVYAEKTGKGEIELAAAWMHACYASKKCCDVYDLTPLVVQLRKNGWKIPLATQPGARPPFARDLKEFYPVQKLRLLSNADAIYQSLKEVGPVVVTMTGDASYFKPSDVDCGLAPADDTDHAICLIGFDNDAGCWLAKNSFGERWGDKGYGRIKYGACKIGALTAYGIVPDGH